jgi:hypothetical protein
VGLRVPSEYTLVGYTTTVAIVVTGGTRVVILRLPIEDMVADVHQVCLEVLEALLLLRPRGGVKVKTQNSRLYRIEHGAQVYVLGKIDWKISQCFLFLRHFFSSCIGAN